MAKILGYDAKSADPQGEGWCWSAKHWRWEYRTVQHGLVLAFIHVELIIAQEWAGLQASLERRELPPLPDEARDIPRELLDRLS